MRSRMASRTCGSKLFGPRAFKAASAGISRNAWRSASDRTSNHSAMDSVSCVPVAEDGVVLLPAQDAVARHVELGERGAHEIGHGAQVLGDDRGPLGEGAD